MAARKQRRRAVVDADDNVELARLPGGGAQAADVPVTVAIATPADIRAERELDDILDEIGGGDVRVKVSRFTDSGAMQACGEMSGDSFSIESLTDTFGGGKYLLRFYQGKSELGRSRVEVDTLIPPRNPRAPKTTAAAPTQNVGDMATVMSTMMTMMMTAMSTQQTGTAAMVSAMTEMMKARQPDKDPMEIALKMAELMKASPGANQADLFSVFEKGMNVAAKLGGGGDGDNIMPVVEQGVRGVTAALEGFAANARANATEREIRARATVAPAGAPVATIPPPPPSQPEAMPVSARPWVVAAMPFRGMLNMMVGKVAPQNASATLLDVLTDDQLDDLLSDIEDATAPGFVVRAFSALRPGEAVTTDDAKWLADVAADVVAATEATDEAAGDAAASGAVGEAETRMTGDGGTGT